MGKLKSFLVVLSIALCGTSYAANIELSKRINGDTISGTSFVVMDWNFASLSAPDFTDVYAFSYLRLGFQDHVGMEYHGIDKAIRVNVTITPYNNGDTALTALNEVLEIYYNFDGTSVVTVDGEDFRMPNIHKFSVEVTAVYVNDTLDATLPQYVYLEGGFSALRYYDLNTTFVPVINAKFIAYDSLGGIDASCVSTTETCASTDEILLTWEYVDGAEFYELEWTWVDNYSDTSLTIQLAQGVIALSNQDFARNSTRIRTSNQHFSIPQVYALGYIVYRVRGVGVWDDETTKERVGAWSGVSGAKVDVADWTNVIEIGTAHQGAKNWQYQATYAEDGKKKEVTQYFDGSLRGRQTVTRINSDKHSVVGETIYDNEGRGVIQILPVPQANPALKYYPKLNLGNTATPYNHHNFDWEDDSLGSCGAAAADTLLSSAGAGEYYSVAAHQTDSNWQQYIPESNGYAFTQVEYTPDNTGRIRNQSGVGASHNIGSDKETRYFYSQPAQEELNRLFGYKVGYSSHYKKNMVIDANGQVSISYLDAQGRVVATALAGESPTVFDPLSSEQASENHNEVTYDLLNKQDTSDVDTPLDNNSLITTGRFGAVNDGLEYNTQLGVSSDNTNYSFTYDITTVNYKEVCTDSISYPYVYDLVLTLVDDCGTELFTANYDSLIGIESIGSAVGDAEQITFSGLTLDAGTYTLQKTLTVNEAALLNYQYDYLNGGNPCLLDSSYFDSGISTDCGTTCEECAEELGTLVDFLSDAAYDLGQTLTSGDSLEYTNLYNTLHDECLSPCELLSVCDAYRGTMLADMRPGGQYGISATDPLSVFNISNSLAANGYDWKNPNTPYADEFGNVEQITAYDWGGGQYHITDNTPGGTGSAVLIDPEDLYLVSEFMSIYQDSWSNSLIYYHPEYPLLQYQNEICVETWAVPTTTSDTVPLTSEEFDHILRQEITTFAKAEDSGTGNNFDINFLDGTSTTADFEHIYVVDPYFNLTYDNHDYAYPTSPSTLSGLKDSLMKYALSNFNGSGETMLEYAYRTAVLGNNYGAGLPTYSTWDSIETFNPNEIDLVWQIYKVYYLSTKGQINQYLMDMHGFNEGMFNGCIGPGSLDMSSLAPFAYNTTNASDMGGYMVQSWFGGGALLNFPPIQPSIPLSLCNPLYNGKQIRVVRMAALYNAGAPAGTVFAEAAAEADYGLWQSSGLCPLTLDMELFLNAMGTDSLMTSTTSMANVNAMTPDLFEGLMGSAPGAGDTLGISGSINGTTDSLELVFDDGSTQCTFYFPDLMNVNDTLDWDDYENGANIWHLYAVYNSYPTGTNNDIQLIMLAGDSLHDAQEYIVTYTNDCVDLNGCQTDFANHPENDPSCQTEEEFEGAMLNLMQMVLYNDKFDSTNYVITAQDFYANTVIPGIIGTATASWVGPDVNNLFTIGTGSYYIDFDMTTAFPDPSTDPFTVVSFDMLVDNAVSSIGSVFITIMDLGDGSITEMEGSYAYYIGTLAVDLDLSCPCEDVIDVDNSGAVNQLEVFLNDVLLDTPVPDGSQPASYLALEVYSTQDLSALTISNFTVNSGLSFDFGSKSFSLDLVSGSTSATLEYVSNSAFSGSGFTCDGHYSDSTIHAMVATLDDLVEFRNAPVPCPDCTPTAQPPVSCTDAYAAYETYMAGVTDAVIMSEPDFCQAGYAYISEAYEDYLDSMGITNASSVQYLSIAAFGTTAIGYSNTELSTAVSAYLNSAHSDTLENYYLTWNNYVGEVYLAINEICPALYSGSPLFPDSTYTPPCDEWENNVLAVNDSVQNLIYLQQAGDAFKQAYIEGAMASVVEQFEETHVDKEYHYTLYYYDRAGNLIQTVPPKGVDRFEAADTDVLSNSAINALRLNSPDETENIDGAGDYQAPEHVLQTKYRYNSLNQLVFQKTPDGGISRFAYDALGRLVMSQNAKQDVADQFSYTKYDGLGRVVEVGELTLAAYSIDSIGRLVDGTLAVAPEVNSALFPGNLSTTREEVTRTIYDELFDEQGDEITTKMITDSALLTVGTLAVSDLFGVGYANLNTRNRIVGVVYQENFDSLISNYDNASFYDYDIHGNVKHLVQINNTPALLNFNQHIKHFDYEYDLVSGNVNKVIYQKDYEDQYIHRYYYDSDNRITIAETSKDGVIFEKDAKYFYYDHGPLARTEISEDKVQACDYAYTIQGWLKAVNGEEIGSTMMGGDSFSTGSANGLNQMVAKDAYGYSLSYYNSDYASANTDMLDYTLGGTPNLGAGLYNGNIRSMHTAISDDDEASIGTHQTNYQYDQLNRIKSMQGFNRTASVNFDTSDYSSNYSFDPNGNLETLKRYAFGQSAAMDSFVYHYNTGNNQLNWVDDLAGISLFLNADIDSTMETDNYRYDAIGQLIEDTDEGIDTILWKVTNKVDEIHYIDGRIIGFKYDAMGNRIAKTEYHTSGDSTATYYTLDAQGNTMGIYRYGLNAAETAYELKHTERNMYGSSRVGIEHVVDTSGTIGALLSYSDMDTTTTLYSEDFSAYSPPGSITLQTLPMPSGWPNWDLQACPSYLSTQTITGGGALQVVDTCATQHDLFFPTLTGRTYTFSADFNTAGASDFYLMYFRHATNGSGDAGNVLYYENLFDVNGVFSYEFVAESEWSRISLRNYGINDEGGTFVIDNILIVEDPVNVLQTVSVTQNAYYQNYKGDKRFELSNHLGNVLSVVSDRKLPTEGTGAGVGTVDYYTADVISFSDYYPFGMTMPGRSYVGGDYRYGFQGQETDSEIKGEGNSVNYRFRMHDPRTGRFFAVDPLAGKYPHNSPYAFSENVVINAVELEGAERKYVFNSLYTSTKFEKVYQEFQKGTKTFDEVTKYLDSRTPYRMGDDSRDVVRSRFSRGKDNDDLGLDKHSGVPYIATDQDIANENYIIVSIIVEREDGAYDRETFQIVRDGYSIDLSSTYDPLEGRQAPKLVKAIIGLNPIIDVTDLGTMIYTAIADGPMENMYGEEANGMDVFWGVVQVVVPVYSKEMGNVIDGVDFGITIWEPTKSVEEPTTQDPNVSEPDVSVESKSRVPQ